MSSEQSENRKEGESNMTFFRPVTTHMIRVLTVCIAVALVSWCAALSVLKFTVTAPHKPPNLPPITELIGSNPIKTYYEPIRVQLPFDPPELERFVSLVIESPDNEPTDTSRSRMLHAVAQRLYGKNDPAWIHRDDQGNISQVVLPEGSLQAGWRGVRVTETPLGEMTEHRDQLLSVFAEIGVPLDATVVSGDVAVPVSLLLQATLDEFHLRQPELSWTATSLVLYCPPQNHWRNRFGERFNLNDVAIELMHRSLNTESCSGTHLVQTLTRFLLIDRGFNILDTTTRSEVEDCLQQHLVAAIKSQNPDGSWPPKWSEYGFRDAQAGFSPKRSRTNSITVAGHILQWFHALPADMKPPEDVVRLASIGLWQQLQAVPEMELKTEFCPYSHAIFALRLAAESPD